MATYRIIYSTKYSEIKQASGISHLMARLFYDKDVDRDNQLLGEQHIISITLIKTTNEKK